MGTERLIPTVGNLSAGVAGVLMVVGSVGPWATFDAFGLEVAGTSTDGKLTLVLGVALVLCALVSMTTDWAGWLIVGLGLAAGAVAAYDLANLSRVADAASVGWGLILVAAASAVAVIAGVSEILEL